MQNGEPCKQRAFIKEEFSNEIRSFVIIFNNVLICKLVVYSLGVIPSFARNLTRSKRRK
jgi:hypothetical protein